MDFNELTVEIQAKAEELAYLCMDMGRAQAALENMKQEKIRRSEELSKLFDQLRKQKSEKKEDKEEKTEEKEEKTAVKKQDPALDIGKIVALRQAGWGVKKIAEELSVTEYKIRKALGLD